MLQQKRALDRSPVALSVTVAEKKGIFFFFSGETHQHFHIHIVYSQHTDMRARQKHLCIVHKQLYNSHG